MNTTRRGFITAAALAAAAGAHRAATAAPTGGKRFYKGQFHTHTYWSDGSAFPEQAIQFYRATGYNFLGLSDHNVYADTHRVKKVGGKGKGIVKQEIFDAYKRDFPTSVQTETAADGSLNVVVQTYAKMRKLFEKPGEFLLLDAVEGTTRTYDEDGVEHQVHMNYLNVPGVPEFFRSCGTKASVAQRIGDSLKAVEAMAKEKGRETMFILNHPIWRWYDVRPEDLVANPKVRFFELCNGGSPYAPGKGLPSDGFAAPLRRGQRRHAWILRHLQLFAARHPLHPVQRLESRARRGADGRRAHPRDERGRLRRVRGRAARGLLL